MTAAHQQIPFGGNTPVVHQEAWVAPNATLIGDVTLDARASVFYGSVLRGDSASIAIGEDSNIQDGVVVHADPDFPTTVGRGVTVGHAAVLHGGTVQDNCLIGMGSVVLNGAVVGAGSMVAAGAVVLEGTQIPPGSLVAGVPGKIRRELTDAEQARHVSSATAYVERAAAHREALRG